MSRFSGRLQRFGATAFVLEWNTSEVSSRFRPGFTSEVRLLPESHVKASRLESGFDHQGRRHPGIHPTTHSHCYFSYLLICFHLLLIRLHSQYK